MAETLNRVGHKAFPAGGISVIVFKRDRYVCQYCGNQSGRDELTIDHVVPRSQGGVSSWTNCVLALRGLQ